MSSEAHNISVITLVLPLADAQRLALAGSEGRILLVLRNPLDTMRDAVAPVNLRDLDNGVAPTNKPVVHYTVIKKIMPAVLPPSSPLRIKVYQGDKKPDEVKCADQTCE